MVEVLAFIVILALKMEKIGEIFFYTYKTNYQETINKTDCRVN